MSEPWNFTETQRRQFREAHAEAKRKQMAEETAAADLCPVEAVFPDQSLSCLLSRDHEPPHKFTPDPCGTCGCLPDDEFCGGCTDPGCSCSGEDDDGCE